jgi:pimeloyl-ACP methyl ester carboxylesterase
MQRTTFLAACAATSALGAFPSIGGAAELDENLETPTGTIYGTLTLPVGRAKPPVVLVIAGSGPTDRNGNASTLVLNMYAKLAAALAERGIATVRYDKRGIAASHAAAPDETSLRFDAYVADAAAWIRKLRADGRFSSVTVVGHSEGSLVGMIAAQSVPVDAYVSLEGAGFPANVVLARQLATNLAPYPELKAQSDRILASLALGKLVVASDVPAPLLSLFRPSVQPYLISWFAYDPRVEIVKTTGRVTIVQGTHDVQVSVDDGKALAAARPSATFVLIDGMTHVLVDDPGTTIAEQVTGAYADASRPLDARLVAALGGATSFGL